MNRKKTILDKVIDLARGLGMDVDELMQMTVIEAMLKVEETREMWIKLREEIK